MLTTSTREQAIEIALIGAPSNLGLRPPEPGSVPGTAKAPEALREAGLHDRMSRVGARDAGTVIPARYRDDLRLGSERVRNQDAIVDHALRLADRIGDCLDAGETPLVLGGDCNILIGVGLAVARRGRFGLVHLDGHTDFRHPGNSDACGSLAGEDLAAAVGLHWDALANIEHRRPYFDAANSVHAGCREGDEHLGEVSNTLALTLTASQIRERGAEAVAETTLKALARRPLAGFWIHLDLDILDPAVMPAVDSPDPHGLLPEELKSLLSVLAPGATGADVTIFDPDLDPDGIYARLVADLLAASFGHLGSTSRRALG